MEAAGHAGNRSSPPKEKENSYLMVLIYGTAVSMRFNPSGIWRRKDNAMKAASSRRPPLSHGPRRRLHCGEGVTYAVSNHTFGTSCSFLSTTKSRSASSKPLQSTGKRDGEKVREGTELTDKVARRKKSVWQPNSPDGKQHSRGRRRTTAERKASAGCPNHTAVS